MNYKKTLFFLLLSLLCSIVIFNPAFAGNGDLSQINKFQPNKPARSSEVNSNFDIVSDAITNNSNEITQMNLNINALNSDVNDLKSDTENLNIDINNHKSYPDAHHPRYTDEEALSAVKAAGVGEVTNNSISTDFISTFTEQGIPIPDNDPVGVTSTITIPDIGIINSITINVEINNSDISRLDIKLIDPNNDVYLLYENNDSATGTLLTGSWPDTNPVLDGDITTWIDKNPKGDWKLWVIDNKDDSSQDGGEITEWGITIQGVSADTVTINGNLTVNGSVRANGGGALITPAKMLVSRMGKTVFFTAADGTQHTLEISDPTQPVGNTHIYYFPNCTENDCKSGNNDNESVLFFNIEDSPSICCTLLSNEEDWTSSSKGLYWATDGGNNSTCAWGDVSTATFKISRDGFSEAIPLANFSGYSIICF